MNKYFKYWIISSIVGFTLLYLGGAFIQCNFNPLMWTVLGRELYCGFCFAVIMITAFISAMASLE